MRGLRKPQTQIEVYDELAHHGWVIIHVTPDMLRNRPWLIVQQVIEALRKGGCPRLDERRVMSRESKKRVS